MLLAHALSHYLSTRGQSATGPICQATVFPVTLVPAIELGFWLGLYTYVARLLELRLVVFSKGLQEYISGTHVVTLNSTIPVVLPSRWSTT